MAPDASAARVTADWFESNRFQLASDPIPWLTLLLELFGARFESKPNQQQVESNQSEPSEDKPEASQLEPFALCRQTVFFFRFGWPSLHSIEFGHQIGATCQV